LHDLRFRDHAGGIPYDLSQRVDVMWPCSILSV